MFAPRREPRPVPRTAPLGAATVPPPGWPRRVRPPGAPEWKASARAWLLDASPPEYRDYPLLSRHPVLLARFALVHVEASQAAVERGLSQARGQLREILAESEVAEAVHIWEREQARLLALRREVVLVEEALRGRRYVPRL